MSDILVINKHGLADALVTTSLVGALLKQGNRVHCMSGGNTVELFRFCGCHSTPISTPRVGYDIAINVSPSLICTETMERVKAKEKFGYGKSGDGIRFFNEGADRHYRARVVGIPTDANIFQLVYGLAQMTWQGEGYGVNYFPRNKTKKNTIGVAVKDSKLSRYVDDSLRGTRLWRVPFKSNSLRQFDEINRCKTIVTDDEGVVHASLALRKHAEFLVRRQPTYKLEMFGTGNIHVINFGQ